MRLHDVSPEHRKSRLRYLNTMAKIRHIAWDRNLRVKVCQRGEGAEGERSETVVGGMGVNVPWGTVGSRVG